MCSLYEIPTPKNQLKVRFRLDALPAGFDGRDVRPTGQAPVIQVIDGQRLATLARWGLIPSWAKDEAIARHTFNARAETLAEKPSFRTAFKHHRCIVPAAAFYEWRAIPGQTKKQRLRFEAADGQPMGLAGLRECWKRPGTEEIVETYTIITTAANEFMSPIHDRMPMLLSDADIEIWLDPVENNPLLLSSLLKPADEDTLKLVEPESPAVE
jgi:putative SOS response-associated peptidase YedK